MQKEMNKWVKDVENEGTHEHELLWVIFFLFKIFAAREGRGAGSRKSHGSLAPLSSPPLPLLLLRLPSRFPNTTTCLQLKEGKGSKSLRERSKRIEAKDTPENSNPPNERAKASPPDSRSPGRGRGAEAGRPLPGWTQPLFMNSPDWTQRRTTRAAPALLSPAMMSANASSLSSINKTAEKKALVPYFVQGLCISRASS